MVDTCILFFLLMIWKKKVLIIQIDHVILTKFEKWPYRKILKKKKKTL